MSCCGEHTGESYSLYRHIDTEHVLCYNEKVKDSIKKVFKPYDKRTDKSEYVESDVDEQMIIYIPFTGTVKLKSMCIIGGDGGHCPSKIKIFANRDDLNFDNIDAEPIQELDIIEDPNGDLDYPLRITKLTNVRSVTLYVSENFGEETSIIHYIGFKGEFTVSKREPVITDYEISPNPSKNKGVSSETTYRTIL